MGGTHGWRAKSLESLSDQRNLAVGEVAFIWDSSQQFLQSEYSNIQYSKIIESYVLLRGQAGYPELLRSLFSSLKPKVENPNFSTQNLKSGTRDSRVIKVLGLFLPIASLKFCPGLD